MNIKSTISKYFNKQTRLPAVATFGMAAVAGIRYIDGTSGQVAVCLALAAVSGYFWYKDVNQGPKPPSA